MRISVERLRIGLLVGAGLLVLVIAAFLGYARYKVGRVIANLPGKLGATVTKEFNGYTYSQSDGKRTIFTIHAAKAMQHTDGKVSLHDVSMILYGHSGDRADRISGDDFEYDVKAQVVKAIGVVHLDLDAAAAAGAANSDARKHLAGPASGQDDTALGSHVIHVKTSGLIYTKESGTATTEQGLEFAFGGYTGHAVGAEYNSTTGHVVLQSAITLSGVDRGRPIALRAAHGELDRAAHRADFRDAHYSSAGEVAQADSAEIHLREDNSIERIDCAGGVALEDGIQGKVASQRAQILLAATNRPKSATLTGGVKFSQERAAQRSQGESEGADLGFNDTGRLNHAVLHGHVKTVELVASSGDAKAVSPQRTLTSDALEIWLAANGRDKPQVRDIKATGAVSMLTVGGRSATDAATRKFSGDLMTAHLVSGIAGPEISSVHGAGHTLIEQKTADGALQKSAGDTLDATFRQAADSKGKSSVELASAVQEGSVAIERSLPTKIVGGPPEIQHATAKTAVFDAGSNLLTLTGDVVMNDAGRQVSAAKVVIAQATGNATADGAVKVTYQEPGSAALDHVLAARAALDHAAGKAVFYGRATGATGHGLARLWQAGSGGQGGSQIEAPVLVFEGSGAEKKNSRLTARAETAGTPGMVHAVLATSNADRASGAQAAGPASKAKVGGVARIVSSEMVYSDADRRVDFRGGVRMVDGTSEVKSQTAEVFLTPAESNRGQNTSKNRVAKSAVTGPESVAPAVGLLGGSVERVIATHQIEITQPGRKATGDRLVYTANDQMFVLTGTSAVPPKVVDVQQGSTTGAELRFHSGDNSVAISGADGNAPARKVETETRVKQ